MIAVGDIVSFENTFTEEHVRQFGELSGDMQPVHFDPEVAARTIFAKPPVHGMLTATVITAALGNHLESDEMYVVYSSQMLDWVSAVYPGDTVHAACTVTKWNGRKAELDVICTNQDGVEVLKGPAHIVLLPFQDAKVA